ncbi:MAG: hypothetical protein LWY06_20260 [Firmicutes bacterium]|nr:hypothetical protein [Bacillota bacterium]
MNNQPAAQPKKAPFFGMGCLGCGLLGCFGSLAVMGVLFFVGMNWFITNFFSKQPLDIPKAYLSSQEEQAYVKKFKAFKEALDKKDGKPVVLTMTMKEFNYQMQTIDNAEKASIYLRMADDGSDQTEVIMSMPMNNDKNQTPLYMNINLRGTFAIEDYCYNINLSFARVGTLETSSKKYLEQISRDIETKIPASQQFRQLPVKVKNLKIDKETITVELISKPASEIVPVETNSSGGG